MLINIIVLALLVNKTFSTSYEKCCDIDSYLVKNVTYQCMKAKESSRLQFLVKNYDYLSRNVSNGHCVDAEDDFFATYLIKNSTVSFYEEVQSYYPKCCPLGYSYDSIRHSCEPTNTQHTSFIQSSFIKVGLPDCELIDDYLVKSLDDFILEDSYIHLRGDNSRHNKGSYCVDKNVHDGYVVRVCGDKYDVCSRKKCVRKCCPDGTSFINGKLCLDTYTHGLDMKFIDRIQKPDDPFAIIHNYHCPRIYIMDPKRYTFKLDEWGNFIYYYNLTNSYVKETVHKSTYCIEHVKKGKLNQFAVFKCYDEVEKNIKFSATAWAKIISVIALILTIIIYIFVGEVKTLGGKVLTIYCLSLLLMLSILVYMHIFNYSKYSDLACVVFGYLVVYLTACSFTWLNVVCFDIWCRIGSLEPPKTVGPSKSSSRSVTARHQQKRDLKKLLIYLLYGWGVPVIIVLNILLFNKIKVLPRAIHPFIGEYKCFVENNRPGNYGHFLFKDIPYLILETINLVLFFKTVRYCLKVKNEINRMTDANMSAKQLKRKALKADKEKLFLVMKLSIITGNLMLFEVLSAFYDMSKDPVASVIEIIWDTIICLQGLFIFIIFICKKRILTELSEKLNLKQPERKISSTSTKFTEMSTDVVNSSPVLARKP